MFQGFGDQVGEQDSEGERAALFEQVLDKVTRSSAQVEKPVFRGELQGQTLVLHQLAVIIRQGHRVEPEEILFPDQIMRPVGFFVLQCPRREPIFFGPAQDFQIFFGGGTGSIIVP